MFSVQVVEVTVGRPMGPEKGTHSRERRIYPAEVSYFCHKEIDGR